jgi:hypothetical protein
MLDDLRSGDEICIEGGEGVRWRDKDDVALSVVKLYQRRNPVGAQGMLAINF